MFEYALLAAVDEEEVMDEAEMRREMRVARLSSLLLLALTLDEPSGMADNEDTVMLGLGGMSDEEEDEAEEAMDIMDIRFE